MPENFWVDSLTNFSLVKKNIRYCSYEINKGCYLTAKTVVCFRKS